MAWTRLWKRKLYGGTSQRRARTALYTLYNHQKGIHTSGSWTSRFSGAPGRQEFSPGSDIRSELKRQGCGRLCYVISIEESIDGAYAPVEDAIQSTIGNGPALMVFNEANLAYFEGEHEIGSKTKRFLIRALSRDG